MLTNYEYILGTLSSGESVPLPQADRRRHIYITGQTGTGKTGLLVNLMRADLMAGGGFCFLDPHGDAAQDIAGHVPAERLNNVIYLDPSDPERTFGYNPLANVPALDRARTAANIVSAFKNIWADSWGPRLEFVLSNALRLLLDAKDQSLIGIPLLFADQRFRNRLAQQCLDPIVRHYWLREFAAYDKRQQAEIVSPIQNKVGILLANPFIRSILCQNSSTLDISAIMNEGKTLIVNLSKGGLGTEPAHLLGALLITAFAQAAEARRHIPEHARKDFTLYCDEFQNFATESFAAILSEARKWRLSLVAVNQHASQLPEKLQHAVFGNAGTIIAFRSGAQDAPRLAAELGLSNPKTLRETNNFNAWARIMHDGVPREPKLVKTLPPPAPGKMLAKVISFSRYRHMVPRAQVDRQIAALFPRSSPVSLQPKKKRRRIDG
jgi:hypothetical protein